METLPIQMPDGTDVPVYLFEGPADAPVVVMFPGLGVPAGYFQLFAEDLVARGFNAAVADLRGQGDSRPKPSSSSLYGYHELVSVDFPAVFEVVRERFPTSTPYLLGHSMGGQLGTLYAARVRRNLGGLILVASGSPYHRGFGSAKGAGLFVGAAAMSLTASIAGFWPGDKVNMGGFGRQSKVLINDWSRFARTGNIEPLGADMDYEDRIRRLDMRVLSITIEGDDMAPRESVENLLEKLDNAEIIRAHISEPLGHNGWIRKPDRVAEVIEEWLRV